MSFVAWPTHPSASWRKGFLAGIFDAEGSNNGCLRIANCDDQIIGHTKVSLDAFGLSTVIEDETPAESASEHSAKRGIARAHEV